MTRIAFGVACAAIASHKGRSVVGWFFGGFFISLVGLIVICCMSNLKEQEAKEAFAERERHRLREQLRQEQIKSESYRRYTMDRLDAHDQALGVDTRTREALPGQEGIGLALPGQAPSALPFDGQQSPAPQAYAMAGHAQPAAARVSQPGPAIWFFEVNGKQRGPVPETEIHQLITARAVSPSTLLWTEGFADWTALGNISQFRYATEART